MRPFIFLLPDAAAADGLDDFPMVKVMIELTMMIDDELMMPLLMQRRPSELYADAEGDAKRAMMTAPPLLCFCANELELEDGFWRIQKSDLSYNIYVQDISKSRQIDVSSAAHDRIGQNAEIRDVALDDAP